MRVTNNISLGCSLRLTGATINCVETLKAEWISSVFTMNSATTLMTSSNTQGRMDIIRILVDKAKADPSLCCIERNVYDARF
jgi:hypothetical protein